MLHLQELNGKFATFLLFSSDLLPDRVIQFEKMLPHRLRISLPQRYIIVCKLMGVVSHGISHDRKLCLNNRKRFVEILPDTGLKKSAQKADFI